MVEIAKNKKEPKELGKELNKEFQKAVQKEKKQYYSDILYVDIKGRNRNRKTRKVYQKNSELRRRF